jgi:hypothetical protein
MRGRSVCLVLIVATVACLGVACAPHADGSNLDAGPDDLQNLNAALDDPSGGLSTDSETLDPRLYSDIPVAVPAHDSTSLDAVPAGHTMTLMLAWGHLPDPDGVDPQGSTDWSGTIEVMGGRVRVDATIGFGLGDRLKPRSDPSRVEFESHTLAGINGFVVHVTQRLPDATLVFSTQPTTLTLSLASLNPEVTGVQPLADRRGGVAFVGYVNRAGCADGVVMGRYRRLVPNLGWVHMRVFDDVGQDIGRLRGFYGHSSKWDLNVLFGKYLSPDGAFRGLIRGSFAEGLLACEWRYNDPNVSGELHGRYWEGPNAAPGSGLTMGHWLESCP